MSNITPVVLNGKNMKPGNSGVVALRLDQILSGTGPLRYLQHGILLLRNCKLELLKVR